MAMECWPSRSKHPGDTCRARQSMNQRKFETRGRPRWTTAPPPRRRVSDSGRALSIGFDRHRPRARLQLPAQNLHERRFAAAVRTDQPITIPAAELHGHVRKKRAGHELHGDAGGDDHGEILETKKLAKASLDGSNCEVVL